jgi:streptogramin lyase
MEDRTLLSFGTLTEYPLPTRPGQPADTSSKPWDITLGPDHNLWFTEQEPNYGNRIGRITPAGAITEFAQGISAGAWPSGISANPYDDRLYFTEFGGNRVGVLDTAQSTITELPLMPGNSQPAETFFVEPNYVFISQSNSNSFAELDIFADPTFVTCVPGPMCPTPITSDSGPWGMASDRNDYFYFTERGAGPNAVQGAGRIGVYGIDTSTSQGKTFEFETPSFQQGKPSQPLSIVEGPDGNLWYTDFAADVIGKITPFDPKTNQVTITEYPLAAGSKPWGIAAGPGGFLYFTEYGGNAIGRIDPRSGAIAVDPLPHANSGPRGITVDSDGILWFVETDGNAIGRYITLSFTPEQTFGAGKVPHGVAVGDFNGDGKPDLAVPNEESNNVSVLLNTTAAGATTASFAPQQTFDAGNVPRAVAVGDFNGDGKPDLAVANAFADTVSVLLDTTPAGATTPSFAPQQTFPVGSSPHSIAVGDFNGDGKPDLAVANAYSDNVSVLLDTTPAGATTPSFAPQQTFRVGSGLSTLGAGVAVGDFNGDGKPDLAAIMNDFSNVYVLLDTTPAGATTPTFAPQKAFPVGTHPLSLAVGDFNGDG